MSRNGSGTYSLPAGNPVVTGTTITSTWANTTLSDIASALTQSVSADGQTPMTGSLNMASNKIIALATPTLATDAVTKAYADALIAGGSAGLFTSVTDSGLTANRVTYATTGGLLTDSANLTFDGTYLTANSIKDTALTSGRITYAGTSGLLQDSASLTFDGTTVTSTKFAGAFNGSLGATTPSTAVVTSLTDSGLTSGRVTYATTSGLLTDSANLTFNGTTLTTANDASISGLTVGKGGGSVASNTVIGNGALASNSTAGGTIAIGYQALNVMTAGDNTAVGYQSMLATTSGVVNTSLGAYTLKANTTGSSNVAIGRDALQANTTASNNTAVGYQAAYSGNAAGTTAIGFQALYANTGLTNTGVGSQALYSNTTGTLNTALSVALYNNTTGSYNVAVGHSALNSNTTASNNTAVGYQAGYSNTTGTGVSVFGYLAGYGNTTGTYNSFFGYGAGAQITTGGKNTIIGAYNGNSGGLDIRTASNYIVLSDGDGNPRFVSNGGGNIGIGGTLPVSWYPAAVAMQFGAAGAIYSNTAINQTVLLNNTYFDTPGNEKYINTGYAGKFILANNGQLQTWTAASGTAGNTFTPTQGPYVANLGTSWTNSSDERLKNITGEITDALNKVGQLRAATYTWKADESAKPQVGLIAQDLLKVLPEVVVVPEKEVDEEGNQQYMGVNYDNVIPLLVAAIQELKTEVDSLKQQLGK